MGDGKMIRVGLRPDVDAFTLDGCSVCGASMPVAGWAFEGEMDDLPLRLCVSCRDTPRTSPHELADRVRERRKRAAS